MKGSCIMWKKLVIGQLWQVTFFLFFDFMRLVDVISLPRPALGEHSRHSAPRNAKRRQDFSCRQAVPAITVSGSRKAAAVRSSPPGSAAR